MKSPLDESGPVSPSKKRRLREAAMKRRLWSKSCGLDEALTPPKMRKTKDTEYAVPMISRATLLCYRLATLDLKAAKIMDANAAAFTPPGGSVEFFDSPTENVWCGVAEHMWCGIPMSNKWNPAISCSYNPCWYDVLARPLSSLHSLAPHDWRSCPSKAWRKIWDRFRGNDSSNINSLAAVWASDIAAQSCCAKCELARVIAGDSSECICLEIVCSSCNKLLESCNCCRPHFIVSVCQVCGARDYEPEPLLGCQQCNLPLDKCECDRPLICEINGECEELGPHSFELTVEWLKPSARICFECQEVIPYDDQVVCESAACLCNEHSSGPLDDGIVFHSRCAVRMDTGVVCRRCDAAGFLPDGSGSDGTNGSAIDEESEEDTDEEDGNDSFKDE